MAKLRAFGENGKTAYGRRHFVKGVVAVGALAGISTTLSGCSPFEPLPSSADPATETEPASVVE